jgi:hypothetical protein
MTRRDLHFSAEKNACRQSLGSWLSILNIHNVPKPAAVPAPLTLNTIPFSPVMLRTKRLKSARRAVVSMARSADRTPRHGNHNTTLHALNQGHGLVHGIRPAFDTPALLTLQFALLQVRKLPQMMHSIQIANLNKPSTNALHDLTSCFQTLTPVRLPFEQVAWVERVGAQFEDTTELARGRGGPEGEFLHQRDALARDQSLELGVEGGELGVVLDAVERSMVTGVSLVFPDVHCITWSEMGAMIRCD